MSGCHVFVNMLPEDYSSSVRYIFCFNPHLPHLFQSTGSFGCLAEPKTASILTRQTVPSIAARVNGSTWEVKPGVMHIIVFHASKWKYSMKSALSPPVFNCVLWFTLSSWNASKGRKAIRTAAWKNVTNMAQFHAAQIWITHRPTNTENDSVIQTDCVLKRQRHTDPRNRWRILPLLAAELLISYSCLPEYALWCTHAHMHTHCAHYTWTVLKHSHSKR